MLWPLMQSSPVSCLPCCANTPPTLLLSLEQPPSQPSPEPRIRPYQTGPMIPRARGAKVKEQKKTKEQILYTMHSLFHIPRSTLHARITTTTTSHLHLHAMTMTAIVAVAEQGS